MVRESDSNRGCLDLFRFKRAKCVAFGTFNIYIVQPAWLTEVGIVPKDAELVVYALSDAPGFRFSSSKLQTRWVVKPDLIQVNTEIEGRDCGDLVAKVIEKLPWTPVGALVNESIYQASPDDLGTVESFFPPSPEMPSGFAFNQRSIHHGLKQGEAVFNLQLSILEDEINLAFNTTTELRGRSSQEVQRAARNFLSDRQTAEKLSAHLFPSSMNHVHDDQ